MGWARKRSSCSWSNSRLGWARKRSSCSWCNRWDEAHTVGLDEKTDLQELVEEQWRIGLEVAAGAPKVDRSGTITQKILLCGGPNMLSGAPMLRMMLGPPPHHELRLSLCIEKSSSSHG